MYLHNDKPLYDHFTDCSLHISVISSSIFESIEFNIPTAVILSEGRDYYSDIISQGIIKYIRDKDDLFQIKKDLKQRNNKWSQIIHNSQGHFFSNNQIDTTVGILNDIVSN